jgi:hypothetical protein
MASGRRRSRAGIPIGVIIAILAAIFSSRSGSSKAKSARDVPQASAPAPAVLATPSTSGGGGGTVAAPASSAPGPATPTRSPGFASRQRLVEHYEKHGAEFPGLSMDAYLAAAQSLRDAPLSAAILEARRADGVTTRFDRGNGAFLAANRDRTIRTYFKPNDGERYFRRQATRAPGTGG